MTTNGDYNEGGRGPEREPVSGKEGVVYIVGAGPGDPELLTVRARHLLNDADVVLHDSLVSEAILGMVPDGVEVIDVGKRPDDGSRWSQDDINQCMVLETKKGNAVVRLKGGDPCLFGRGGEEAEYLSSRGVEFEIVPGITSAVAAPELVGIPPTHREHASTLTVLTGHEDPTKDESSIDWGCVAGNVEAGGTLVILMGVGLLEENMMALMEHGVDGATPAALVEKATWDDESVVSGTVADIAEKKRREGIEPPAVTVVGDVVGVRDELTELTRSLRWTTPIRLPGDAEIVIDGGGITLNRGGGGEGRGHERSNGTDQGGR